jgi:hypothetical protein
MNSCSNQKDISSRNSSCHYYSKSKSEDVVYSFFVIVFINGEIKNKISILRICINDLENQTMDLK